jgi:acetyl esterase/lipase
MTTRPLVDPELAAAHDTQRDGPVNADTQAEARACFQILVPHRPELDEVEVAERHVPGSDGAPDVRVLVYRPRGTARPLPGLLWIHCGGYVLGSADRVDMCVRNLVAKVGCVAVSVDYRLAPETPFPGPLEDCYAALRWLHSSAAELGVDASRHAAGGDSAGGGLTAALAQLARDRGEVPLVFQLLLYPMLDDRTCTSSDLSPHVGEFIWNNDSNRFGWTSLLGHAPGEVDPPAYAVPARTEYLGGLPPAWIGVGALDLFLDENVEYARRLMRAGVPTSLHVYPSAYHGFDVVREAAVSRSFEREYVEALRRALKLA